MDDITIGEGQHYCTAIKISDELSNISQNHSSYWVRTPLLNIKMTIYKSSEEGTHLTKMLIDKSPPDEIYLYLEGVMLKHIDPIVLMNHIKTELHNSFIRGRRDKEREIQEVLGIR